MKTPKSTSSLARLPRPVYYLVLATLANSLGTFLLPFIPLYLEQMQIPVNRIGQTVGAYGAGALLACVGGGHLSDKLGRKPVILINLLASGCFTAAIPLARALPVILILLFIIGFSAGMSRPAVNALVGDLTDSVTGPLSYGLLYWSNNAGFLIASLAGGVIASRSFSLLFAIDSVTCFLAFSVLSVGFRKTSIKTSSATGASEEPQCRSESLIHLIILLFFMWFIQTQAWTALPMTITSRGLNSIDWGIVSAANGAVVLLFQPVSIKLIKYMGMQYSLAIGCLVLGAGFAVTPLLASVTGFVLQTAVWSTGEVMVATTAPAMIAQLTSPSERGRWMGYMAASFSLASVIGPALGGGAIARQLDSQLWMACFILGLSGALVVGYSHFFNVKSGSK